MAFIYGRRTTIDSWVTVRPRSFWDWENEEGVLTPELCDEHEHKEGTPMLLEQATPANVARALQEINAFEWEGDFKATAPQALKQLFEDRLEQEMAEYLGLSRYEYAAIGTIIEMVIISGTCSPSWGSAAFGAAQS
jgi:hypothetical protein